MNYYLRYFDDETLVHTIDEAIEFLQSIPEINITPEMEQDIREYAGSEIYFPKRYKVRARLYFIIIKTEAATMQDFKDKKALRHDGGAPKAPEHAALTNVKRGWYEGKLDFKRVVVNHLGKCEYRDTTFVARCIADSPMACYERITTHLKGVVDSRSQFPSAKGKNFSYQYLGTEKREDNE